MTWILPHTETPNHTIRPYLEVVPTVFFNPTPNIKIPVNNDRPLLVDLPLPSNLSSKTPTTSALRSFDRSDGAVQIDPEQRQPGLLAHTVLEMEENLRPNSKLIPLVRSIGYCC